VIFGNDRVEFVGLKGGEQIQCDMVIIGIGVVANTGLAQEAGLEIGPTGGIKVDEFQGTIDPNILAVGDCAEKYSFFNGQPVPVRLASVATIVERYSPELSPRVLAKRILAGHHDIQQMCNYTAAYAATLPNSHQWLGKAICDTSITGWLLAYWRMREKEGLK